MTDLLTCPSGCHVDFITMQQVGTRHMMKCDCGWTAPIRANKERAIAAWNDRAQLSERDPIGAAIMRERALKAASSVVQDYKDQGGYKYADAAEYAVDRIHAIPLPTPAETLAYALQLPEIKALVTKCNGMVKGDYPSESLSFMAALKDHVEELEAALAALEPKP